MEKRAVINTPLGRAEGVYKFVKGVPEYGEPDLKRFSGEIKEKGLKIDIVDGKKKLVAVGGNTYPYREELKSVGLRWNSADRVWSYLSFKKMLRGFELPEPEEVKEV